MDVRWSPSENVTWKLEMPNRTGATPIIWGNSVFLNVADGDDLYLWRVDKTKGPSSHRVVAVARAVARGGPGGG
jgi:hypothetical protein